MPALAWRVWPKHCNSFICRRRLLPGRYPGALPGRRHQGVDPMLGLLSNDGPGLVWYYLPQSGSPLMDAAVSPCSPLDQRHAGSPNPCDIGAVEYGGLVGYLYLPIARR